MVEDTRHAAGHTTYEVHEILEGDPAVDLGLRFSSADFSDAIELALDYLRPEEPSGREISALEIVKVEGDRREVVWSYSRSGAPASHEDLIRLWGADPTQSWNVPPSLRR
jgi:hypothetical protein